MLHWLPVQIPWFIAGPAIGLLVVGLYAVANRPLGASGAYLQTMDLVRRGAAAEPWRAWYFGGILVGGLIVGFLGHATSATYYGPLGRLLPLGLLVPVLFGAGVLMGYGARWMGGCTSGHGLCGTSARSAASMASTATFFATAVAITLALHVITGGSL